MSPWGCCLILHFSIGSNRREDKLDPVGRVVLFASRLTCTPASRAQDGMVSGRVVQAPFKQIDEACP
jgi:hypothetical protein